MKIKNILGVVLTFLMVGVLSVSASVVFDGGFETGDHSQWSDLSWNQNRPEAEQFEIVTTPVRRGTYSAKMTVHDGDEFLNTGGERVQLERPDAHNEHEGDEYWYQWSTYFPAGWQNLTNAPDDDWLLIADWHATNNVDFGDVCQPLQLEINGDNQLIATMLSGDVTGYDCFNGPGTANYYDQVIVDGIDLGKWNDFVIHVKWTVENTGVVEIWHKTDDETSFEKVFDQANVPTLQYVNNKNNTDVPYFILAHYRSEEQAHTSILYQDAFKQATSLYDLDEYNGVWWQPNASEKLTWQWDLTNDVDTSIDVDVYDVDLFDTAQSKIDTLHADGRKVICYFSAGSREDWRSDAGDFPASVVGNDLAGWAGEKWLDIRGGLPDADGNGTSDSEELRNIMKARLDLAVTKECDGVEPDNVDGYSNNTGFTLTATDQLAFNNWLATEAHNRNLSIGLKNDVDQINDLVDSFDWALNEQCYEYNECDGYQSFITANKSVFGVEYDGDVSTFCPQANTSGYSWLKKNLNLDAWRYGCEDYSVDVTAPIISEVTPVSSPTSDNTPDYVFTTDEAGTITYGGSCSSADTAAIVGNNTITFNTLGDGTYSDCTITVTDSSANVSNVLSVSSFTVDTSVQAINLSGEWTLFANGFQFKAVFSQNGTALTGHLIYNGTQNQEPIHGTVNGGVVTFYRDLSSGVSQKYVSTHADNDNLAGDFSHDNQWGYTWTATRNIVGPQAVDLSGKWSLSANGFGFKIFFFQDGGNLTGYMIYDGIKKPERIHGTVNGSVVTFYRDFSNGVSQKYVSTAADDNNLSGNFSHNNQGSYGWSATREDLFGYAENLFGIWSGSISTLPGTLDITVVDNVLEGNINFTGIGSTENIKGIVDGSNFTFFRDSSFLAIPQEYQGTFDGGTQLNGFFSHNGVWGGYPFSFDKQ